MKTSTALALFLALILPAAAETKPIESRTITVTGHGEVKAAPDQASYTVSLRARHKSAETATDQVNTAAKGLIDSLQKQGIEKKDITTDFSGVNPEYDNDTPGKIVAYSANYTATVVFHDLPKAAKIAAQWSSLPGVANVNGPSLGFSNPLQFENEALVRAVDNARSKALALAKAGGLVLKEPVTIRTGDASIPRPMPMMMAMRAKVADGTPAPIEAGEQTVAGSVEITYAAALP